MILICGIPNSGKTFFSSLFKEVVHYDEIKKNNKERKQYIIEKVKNNNNICIEGVYGKSVDRINLIEISKEKNVCIWLNTPLLECIKREEKRGRPKQLTIWAAESFEPPILKQGWDKIIIIQNDQIQQITK